MRANGVLMISLIYRRLWSKNLNETIHALVCIFHQKLPVLLTQDAPDFCPRCQPVVTVCHPSAGEGIGLTAPRLVFPSECREGCEAGGSCSSGASALPCSETALACERVTWGQGQFWLL